MIEDVIKNLEKGKYLLENICDDTYTNKSIAPYHSSIGAHSRHILDMFHCVFLGFESQVIDFTKRERNTNVETYTAYGITYFNTIIGKLKNIEHSDLEIVVSVVDDLGSGCCTVKTTLGAILAQSHSHAIHHFATIGYLLHHLNVCLPCDSFGFNPTTPKKVCADK